MNIYEKLDEYNWLKMTIKKHFNLKFQNILTPLIDKKESFLDTFLEPKINSSTPETIKIHFDNSLYYILKKNNNILLVDSNSLIIGEYDIFNGSKFLDSVDINLQNKYKDFINECENSMDNLKRYFNFLIKYK